MGKVVTVEYEDDLDGGQIDADDVDIVEFSYRGNEYTLVLTADNGAQFDKDVARYITAAKRAAKQAQAREARAARRPKSSLQRQPTKTKPAPRRRASSRRGAVEPSSTEVREWAAANGHRVARRGRISAAVMAAYRAAH
ncbi:Lsr2 dimerization domain-containing protein [Mycolicibacterium conceptionense]|uniref:Lsr2 dimerization domain-containing protein n=1 Tax=Mycolicibacterium conceptionense TaxID=451644 RepID=UPI00320462A6